MSAADINDGAERREVIGLEHGVGGLLRETGHALVERRWIAPGVLREVIENAFAEHDRTPVARSSRCPPNRPTASNLTGRKRKSR